MRWLVDAMNVIGSRPDGWWKDRPGAVRRLLDELARYRATTGDDVTVVVDGRPVAVPVESDLEVVFVPHADGEIARRAGPGVRVVTSDRELAERARAEGAEVVGARGFRQLLDGA